MLYFALGLCATTLSTVLFTSIIKKRRLSDDKTHAEAIRKLMTEISELREERAVMRNLLRDMMDNEALVQQATAAMPDDDRVRLLRYRKERRFELFGESLAVLGDLKPVVLNWHKNARELS